MRINRTRIICIVNATMLAVCSSIWAVEDPNGRDSENPSESSTSDVKKTDNSDVGEDIDLEVKSAKKLLEKSIGQWPTDKREQVIAITDRLQRVSKVVNDACGTSVIVLLSETGRGGKSTGNGVVYVDMSVLWQVSEDALAVLIVHEIGHEVLGHTQDLINLKYYSPSLPSRMQQLRELERQADSFAGGVLARTSYDPAGFKELLNLGQDTEWADPEMRAYYPNRDRIKELYEGYKVEKTSLERIDHSKTTDSEIKSKSANEVER